MTNLDVDHAGIGYRQMTLAGLAAAGVPEAVVLTAYQNQLCAWVDERAEQLRAKVASAAPGQMAEYQQAQVEATAALADIAAGRVPDPTRYLMLAASVGIDVDPQTNRTATDVGGVARSVQRAADQFLEFGAAVRTARLSGKKAILAALTNEAAEEAMAAIAWPSAG